MENQIARKFRYTDDKIHSLAKEICKLEKSTLSEEQVNILIEEYLESSIVEPSFTNSPEFSI